MVGTEDMVARLERQPTTVRKLRIGDMTTPVGIYDLQRKPVHGDVEADRIYLAKFSKGYLRVTPVSAIDQTMVLHVPEYEVDPREERGRAALATMGAAY